MDYNTLLQQALKLTNDTQTLEDLPKVERSLPQVLQATNELHSRVTQSGATQDIQAHIFLGAKGIDLPKISQKVETLSARKTFEPLDPIDRTDIQRFLRNEKENAILSVIEEVHKNSFQSAQARKWEHIMSDWRQEKVKLMNALIGPSQNWIDIRKGPEQTILNETTYGGKSCLNREEMAYAREVYDYNKLIIEGAMRPSLVQRFAHVAEGFNDLKVNEMWEIMKYMVNVPAMPRTQDPLKKRQRPEFIEQAKKYLESRYKLYMSTVVAENLRDANLGGVPSTINLVSSYVGLKFNKQNSSFMGLQDGFSNGRPLWPLVYYCLRCGDIQSAITCIKLAGSGHDELIAVLEEKQKNNQHISSKIEQNIKMQYKRQIRNATDPYKRAVYCIVGCCDIHDQHPEVAKTSDDYLWIQLSLIRPESEDTSTCLTFSGLQRIVLEQYGEKHYNATEQPHLYFQVLALTAQFEAAIEFLSRFDRYRTHAVHIAIALSEMFLIGGPRNVQEPLISVDIEDAAPMRRLNMARLIMLYVKKFEITDPAEALQYFYFLRNSKDPEGKNLFLVCVTDLAIECRDYDLLFGKLQSNGMRSRGLIDQFETTNIDAKMACEMVAEDLVKKGMFEDAVNLFELASNYEQTLRYISIMLSQVVHQKNKPGSLRERLQIKSNEITQRMRGEDIHCDSQIHTTFNILKNLVLFFDFYNDNQHQAALETLESIKLVPLTTAELETCVQNFRRLSGEICKVFPDLLLATMNIIYEKYKTHRGKEVSRIENNGRESQLAFLRKQAKAITNFAASVPYRMPGDTNSRLVQTEILMH